MVFVFVLVRGRLANCLAVLALRGRRYGFVLARAFFGSQPMVNTPSAAITTNARKRFISIPFSGKLGETFCPAGTAPARASAPLVISVSCRQKRKKADVPEHPKEFKHVGLPVNEPPG